MTNLLTHLACRHSWYIHTMQCYCIVSLVLQGKNAQLSAKPMMLFLHSSAGAVALSRLAVIIAEVTVQSLLSLRRRQAVSMDLRRVHCTITSWLLALCKVLCARNWQCSRLRGRSRPCTSSFAVVAHRQYSVLC